MAWRPLRLSAERDAGRRRWVAIVASIVALAAACSNRGSDARPLASTASVIGRDERTAVDELRTAGFKVKVSRGSCIPASQRGPEYAGPPSQVVRQTPDATQVSAGTTVRLTVAREYC